MRGIVTHDDVKDRGGPSSPTLTKIAAGAGATISLSTARKIEKAFGWPEGRVAALGGGIDLRAERRTRGLEAHEMAEVLGVGVRVLLGWEQGDPIPPTTLEQVRALLSEVPSSELLAELARREAGR